MRKIKYRRRKIGNMSIIYLSSIIALSFMGVGYAAWSGDISIGFTITTGNMQGRIGSIKNSEINLDNGESLSHKFSNENKNLFLVGKVYPTFNGNIPIKIIDEGNVPVKLENIDIVATTKITELKEAGKKKFSRMTLIDEGVVKSLVLSVNPDNDKDKDSDNHNRSMQGYSLSDNDEISKLEDQISNLKSQIDEYDTEIEYDFEYELLLEQDL